MADYLAGEAKSIVHQPCETPCNCPGSAGACSCNCADMAHADGLQCCLANSGLKEHTLQLYYRGTSINVSRKKSSTKIVGPFFKTFWKEKNTSATLHEGRSNDASTTYFIQVNQDAPINPNTGTLFTVEAREDIKDGDDWSYGKWTSQADMYEQFFSSPANVVRYVSLVIINQIWSENKTLIRPYHIT